MSKNCKQTYDVTTDAVNYTLDQMKNFYLAHPMPKNKDEPEASISFYFDVFFEKLIKGWKELEYVRHPYDYNRKMANYSDVSARHLRRIYNKK